MNDNTTMPDGYDDMFIKKLIIKFDFLSIGVSIQPLFLPSKI